MEHLYIDGYWRECWQVKSDEIQSSQRLELLLLFTAVKHLYVSFDFTPKILPFIEELAPGRVTEVLPTLQTIFLEELLPFRRAIERLVAARWRSGHPIAVSCWEAGRTVPQSIKRTNND